MSKLVTDNTFEVTDIRDVLIQVDDLVAIATPYAIKVGTVIGFRENVTQCNSYTQSAARVVVQCFINSETDTPSTILYPTKKLLCIKELAEDYL
jgi:hypothetical protein